MSIFFFIFFFISSLLFIYLCRKFDLLIDYKLEKHKRYSSKIKSNSIGGIILGSFFIYQFTYYSEYYLLFFLVLIFLIGFLSDTKILNNVGLRFGLQLVIIILFTLLLDYKIVATRIDVFDQMLNYNFFNVIFVTFCLMVLINGANFIDGLNSLLIGYFLIIYFIILSKFGNFVNIDTVLLLNLIIILSFLLIINLSGFIYMGDSGAYLLAVFTGIYLINFSSQNFFISPYLTIVLLWYPCFELLFSMVRRFKNKSKAYKPDVLHLHQLVYFFYKNKFKTQKAQIIHFISSFSINFYNFFILIYATKFVYDSKFLILLLLTNIAVYLSFYFFLKKQIKN